MDSSATEEGIEHNLERFIVSKKTGVTALEIDSCLIGMWVLPWNYYKYLIYSVLWLTNEDG
jgi:hypothetical protein